MEDRSKVLKFAGFRWDTVPVQEYKAEGAPYKDVTRQTLLGESEGPCNFVTRYFEIQPGGNLSQNNRGERRTVNTRNRPQNHLGSRHGSAGIAGSDEAGGAPVAH